MLLLAQVTAQHAEVQQSQAQALPAMTLSSGADPPPPLAAAAAAPQAQPGMGGAQPPGVPLGGAADMQMAQELGLLPTSPLSTGAGGAGALLSCAGGPAASGGQLGAPAPSAAPALLQPVQPAAPVVPPAAAAAPVAIAQQLLPPVGGPGLQPALPLAQQAVAGGAAVLAVSHAVLPAPQVGLSAR